jgi:predicted nucleic acid-binding Zn ribbon protein
MPQPLSLQHVISDVLKEFGLDKKARAYSVLTDWPRIVGEKIASATVAEKLEKGVLTVRVKNAVWRHELSMQKASIIEKIAKEYGAGLVRDILWRI